MEVVRVKPPVFTGKPSYKKPLNPPKITTLVLDLDKVLIEMSPDYVFIPRLRDLDKRKFFYEHVCPPEWHKQQLEGYPIAYAIEEKLAEYPDFEKEIKWYYGQYDVHVRNPEYGMLGLLQQLFHMDKYKGYVLANWPAETYQLLLENYKFYFLRWFKGIVLSGAEGISKPDPRLFQILIDRYSLNVNETLYIDDDQRNLDVAKQLGMHTLLYYEGIEKVIDQLQDIYDIAT